MLKLERVEFPANFPQHMLVLVLILYQHRTDARESQTDMASIFFMWNTQKGRLDQWPCKPPACASASLSSKHAQNRCGTHTGSICLLRFPNFFLLPLREIGWVLPSKPQHTLVLVMFIQQAPGTCKESSGMRSDWTSFFLCCLICNGKIQLSIKQMRFHNIANSHDREETLTRQ